jgi:chitinase
MIEEKRLLTSPAIAGQRLRGALRSRAMGLLLVSMIFGSTNAVGQHRPPERKEIIAYVFAQNRALAASEIAANKLARINYAFANIRDGRIVNGFQDDDQNLATLISLKQQNPSLRVLASVGGWEWSGAFSDMALSKESRRVFIESVMRYIELHQIDGLDIDWEYPGQKGSTTHFRSEDKGNFTRLVRELRRRMNREQRHLQRPLLLTIAAGASSSYLAHTEMRTVQRYLTSINLMTYDYYVAEGTTGNHAPLFTDPGDPKQISAERSIREFEQAGVPADKIVLGVPFYGRQWGEVADVQHGLFQPGKPLPRGYAPYSVIASTLLSNGFERYWDQASSVPYLYNAAQRIFVTYEDPESLAIKSLFVVDHHLAGVMFWDYAGDPSGELLDVLYKGLMQPEGYAAR